MPGLPLVVSPPLDRASSVGVPHSTPLSTCQTQNPWCLLRTLARVRERPPIVGLELFAPIISILTRVNIVNGISFEWVSVSDLPLCFRRGGFRVLAISFHWNIEYFCIARCSAVGISLAHSC